jgi:hypothetical protein
LDQTGCEGEEAKATRAEEKPGDPSPADLVGELAEIGKQSGRKMEFGFKSRMRGMRGHPLFVF